MRQEGAKALCGGIFRDFHAARLVLFSCPNWVLQLVEIEPVTVRRLIGAMHPVGVDGSRLRVRQIAVPDLVGELRKSGSSGRWGDRRAMVR
jgi:hypothetical protein